MKVIILLLASTTIVFAYNSANHPFRPFNTCNKIQGISGLPLTKSNVCDTRDACDIISPGAKCIETALDRSFACSKAPAEYPMMTCYSPNCSANSPPTGMKGVLQCVTNRLYGVYCHCPAGTTAIYSCGICGSPTSSTCFCCSG